MDVSPLDAMAQKSKAILMATAWVDSNRPDLTRYIGQSVISVAKESDGDRYYVALAVNGPKGYEQLFFWADLENETIELAGSS